MNADHLPDDTSIRPLGSRMVCTRRGHVGADVLLLFATLVKSAGFPRSERKPRCGLIALDSAGQRVFTKFCYGFAFV